MKAGEQQRLRAFGNHILNELSSASTHAAFAYFFSNVSCYASVRISSPTLLAIDGSKFKGLSHRDRNFTSAKLERRMRNIESGIAPLSRGNGRSRIARSLKSRFPMPCWRSRYPTSCRLSLDSRISRTARLSEEMPKRDKNGCLIEARGTSICADQHRLSKRSSEAIGM
jgi:hypothetical protein